MGRLEDWKIPECSDLPIVQSANVLINKLPLAHQRLCRAIRQNAVHVQLSRPDHEIDVNTAAIAARAFELVIAHVVSAVQRELVCVAERDVARGVLVEQRVVEQQPGLGNRRTVRHERNFAEAPGAFVGVEQALKRFRFFSAVILTTRPSSNVSANPSINVLP